LSGEFSVKSLVMLKKLSNTPKQRLAKVVSKFVKMLE